MQISSTHSTVRPVSIYFLFTDTEILPVSDDDMVNEGDADKHACFFYTFREHKVCTAGAGVPAGMVVHQHHGYGAAP